MRQLNSMEIIWCELMLKDSIKEFACFYSSHQHLLETFAQVFEKNPINNKQIINGFSWVTEDLTIADYIFNNTFSKEFRDANQNDPSLPEELQITGKNLSEAFVEIY